MLSDRNDMNRIKQNDAFFQKMINLIPEHFRNSKKVDKDTSNSEKRIEPEDREPLTKKSKKRKKNEHDREPLTKKSKKRKLKGDKNDGNNEQDHEPLKKKLKKKKMKVKKNGENNVQDHEPLKKKLKKRKMKVKNNVQDQAPLRMKQIKLTMKGEQNDGNNEHDEPLRKKKRKKKKAGNIGNGVTTKRGEWGEKMEKVQDSGTGDGMDSLRQKLHARIEELKGRRKLITSEHLEQNKQKRIHHKETKIKKKKNKEKNKSPESVQSETSLANQKPSSSSPIYNKEGKIVFSKFDFSTGEKEKSQSGLTGKDFKTLLEKIEKKKRKIDKLKSSDKDASVKAEEKNQWKNAIYRAQGEKIHDDPERLKKALKVKEKRKDKRKKKWDNREEVVVNQIDYRQNKRNKNIQARKKGRIDKKIKNAKKRGRILGF